MNTSENSSLTSISPLFHHCSNIFTAICWIRVILLLPLSSFILYLGLQKWRQHRSFKTASHFDIFTYHLAAMEFLWVLGYLCQICAVCYNVTTLILITKFITLTAFYGEILFHILVCVEQYIAVVYPITYLRMRNTCGERIRNISIGFIWLLSFGMTSSRFVKSLQVENILLCFLMGFATVITTFCSSLVLCALIRLGPGQKSGEKGSVDQSKRRAFHIITTISGVQWLWFLSLLASTALLESPLLNYPVACVLAVSVGFCNLPSSLVLPLLYLHRAGKLSNK